MKRIKTLTLLGTLLAATLPMMAATCGAKIEESKNPQPKPATPPSTTGDIPSKPIVPPAQPIEPIQPTPLNPDPQTQPEPSKPVVTDDNTLGGTVNGISINAYKTIIPLLDINSNMTASQVFEKINGKLFENEDYKLQNVKVVEFNDKKGTLDFTLKGTYKGKRLDNVTLHISHLYVIEGTDFGSLKIEWNLEKLMSEQKNPDYLLNKKADEVIPYLKNLELLLNNKIINVLTNSSFKINTFNISKNGTKFNAFISISYLPQSMSNGKITPIGSIGVYNRTYDNLAGLNYSAQEYLSYVLNNHVKLIDNIDHNYYPSFFAAKNAQGVNYWTHFFEIDPKFEMWNGQPIQFECKYYPNDLTGELFVIVSLKYDADNGSEVITYGNKEFKITGFNKISSEYIKKNFYIVPDSFKFIDRKPYRDLVTTITSLPETEVGTFKISNQNELIKYLGPVGGDNYIIARQVTQNGEEILELISNNYIKLNFKHKSLQDWNIKPEEGLLNGNLFKISQIVLKTTSLSNFEIQYINSDNSKISFRWNYVLEFEVQSATSFNGSTTMLEIPLWSQLTSLKNQIK
ncbi:lipoprotein 17-related variable surface protein [Mycoplasma sp. VS424B]|uniref:lipoprotein 17-related variable surface protein n=1 Tax=unclassified Mycoplasma TaxID=2683645 RepID=UPI003AAC50E8